MEIEESLEKAIDDCDEAIATFENMIITLKNMKSMLQDDLERIREKG